MNADAFDDDHDRPYRAGLTMEQAIAQMTEKAGSQFAAEIVEVFVRGWSRGRFGWCRNRSPYVAPPVR